MTPMDGRVLLRLWWVDATNRAGGWHDAEALDEFATNGAREASNTGWLVYEDDHCHVLAGRMADDGQHVGLVERIPKAAVTRKEQCPARVLAAARVPRVPGRVTCGTAVDQQPAAARHHRAVR